MRWALLPSAFATDLATTTTGFINLSQTTANTFVDASNAGDNGGEFTFTTGNTVPSGDVVVFIRNESSTEAGRIQFDNVRVYATAVPEPASLILLSSAAAGLLVLKRRCAVREK